MLALKRFVTVLLLFDRQQVGIFMQQIIAFDGDMMKSEVRRHKKNVVNYIVLRHFQSCVCFFSLFSLMYIERSAWLSTCREGAGAGAGVETETL